MKNQKGFARHHSESGFVHIILILVIVVVAIGGAYYFGTLKTKSDFSLFVPTSAPTVSAQPSTNPIEHATTNSTVGWKTYTNTTNKFSIKYPGDWSTWSQGPVKDAWQVISSPDLAQKGSQEPKVGMSAGIRVYKQDRVVYQGDIEKFEEMNGLPSQNVGAKQIFKNVGSIGEIPLINYEYEGSPGSYPFHYWVMNIADGQNIVSIIITDHKVDKSLNAKEIASEILSSFEFIK